MCRPIGTSAWAPAADSPRNLSDAVSVEVVTLGQDREPGVPVMSIIPMDVQRRCEQRWAARFCRPASPAAPQSQPQQQQQLYNNNSFPNPPKPKEKPAGLKRRA
jgi:hypothetical protein